PCHRPHVPRTRRTTTVMTLPPRRPVTPHPAPAMIRETRIAGPDTGPYDLTCGPDGALWVTMVHAGQIARLTRDGRLDSYQLTPASCRPSIITEGPDGALWFTRNRDHRIGRITLDGETSAFPTATPDS